MQKLRTAITALIALALAGLPVPAAAMHASMITGGIADTAASDMDGHSAAQEAQDQCCPQMENCEKHTKKGCDRSDACAAKCAALSANVVAGTDLVALPVPSLDVVALTERLLPAQAHPALPPPRL